LIPPLGIFLFRREIADRRKRDRFDSMTCTIDFHYLQYSRHGAERMIRRPIAILMVKNTGRVWSNGQLPWYAPQLEKPAGVKLLKSGQFNSLERWHIACSTFISRTEAQVRRKGSG
jgi:hypothetical protein